jgi:hypothetical protein
VRHTVLLAAKIAALLICLVLATLTIVKTSAAVIAYNPSYLPPNTTLILIMERSGQTLYNYTVKIVLTSSNFMAWNSLTCDAVRNASSCNFWFTDTEGNPLYYWVEYFNAEEKRAVIWVRIPKIPANGIAVILMHWGTTNPYSTYLSMSEAGILFYEDFSTDPASRWSFYRARGDANAECVWNSTEGVLYLTKAVGDRGCVAILRNVHVSGSVRIFFKVK